MLCVKKAANKNAGLRPAMITESKTAGCGAATPAVGYVKMNESSRC